MDAIREQFEKPVVAGAVFFFVGLLIGLVVLGWWLWPVQWTNAGPADLRADAQEDYLRMAVDSYALTADTEAAARRYADLGEAGPDLLTQIQTDPGYQDPGWIQGYAQVVGVQAPIEEEAEGGSNITLLLLMAVGSSCSGVCLTCRSGNFSAWVFGVSAFGAVFPSVHTSARAGGRFPRSSWRSVPRSAR